MNKHSYMRGIDILTENGIADFSREEYTQDIISIFSGVKHYSGEQWEYVCNRIEKPTHIKDFSEIGGRYDIVSYILRRTKEIKEQAERNKVGKEADNG